MAFKFWLLEFPTPTPMIPTPTPNRDATGIRNFADAMVSMFPKGVTSTVCAVFFSISAVLAGFAHQEPGMSVFSRYVMRWNR